MLVRFSGLIEIKRVKGQMTVRQDYMEWQMSRAEKPTIKMDYTEYRTLLQLVGECARIMERSKQEIVMIDDMDLLVPVEDNPDITQKFDCILQSNRAFEELEESLFGPNGN